jgi:hypothetical protein
MSLDARQKAVVRMAILAGVRPSVAYAAIRRADAAGQAMPTDTEIDEAAHETTAQQYDARLAWIADASVPLEFKLLLEARDAES